MSSSKIRTLLLYAQYHSKLSYYDDWLDAFSNAPAFETTPVNICASRSKSIVKKSIAEFDLIILLHSAMGDQLEHILAYREIFQARRGKLLSFVGNEVNLPGALIRDKITFIRDVEADIIATQLPLEAGKWLYAECTKSLVAAVPHALNPDAFSSTVEQERRTIDIGVRSYKYPSLLGDNDRNELIDYVLRNKDKYGLTVDADFTQRFNRAGWAAFLNQCKGTIATEAGSYFLERDDRTVEAITAYCKEKVTGAGKGVKLVNANSPLYKLRALIPMDLRKRVKRAIGMANELEISYLVPYNEIYDKFFKNYPPNPVYTKAISSRHFDAIGTMTCQIMFPGKFNDILVADKHYIALQKDFSNMDECVRKFRDEAFRGGMVRETYEYVMTHHTYKQRTGYVEKIVRETNG